MKKVKVLELQKSCEKYEIITNKISRYRGVCGVWVMYDNHNRLLEVAQTADVFKELAYDLSWLLKEYSYDGDWRKRYTARRLFELNQKFDVLSCDKNRTTATKTSILFAQKKKAEDVALWDIKWDEVSNDYQHKKTRVENLVLVHDGLKKKKNLPSIKDMSANEEHTLICEFLKDFLVEKDKELDVDSLIEKYRLELRDLCSYDKDTVDVFGYVNTWWVFSEVSRCFDYEVFMAEVDNIGYKRTKRGEKETQNDLYSLEYAPKIINFDCIQEEYQNKITEVEVLIKKEQDKLSKEKDGKKISSINKKIRNAVDKEIKLKDDLKRIELFVNKYYDKYYELKEEYAERTNKDLIDMFRIGLLKNYKSEKIALRESTLLTVLDYLRKLNWN